MEVDPETDRISNEVIGAAIRVHSALGPGLLEKIYEECLCYVLHEKGLCFERQKVLPITFEDIVLDAGLKIDLVVEGRLLIELKAVEQIIPVHEAQLYSYLKLSKISLGLLLNFNVKLMKHGIKRMIMPVGE
jgi:GxxExxY protein